jgi:hypothetical protein
VCLIIPAYDWNTNIKIRYTPSTIRDCFNASGTSNGLTSKLYLRMYATRKETQTTDKSIAKTTHLGKEWLWNNSINLVLKLCNITGQ